jgi:4-hydroxy-2-oxoheptanedioate aldolase
MRPNKIKSAVARGEKILNAWCSIPASYVAEALSHLGYDSVTIDLQHGGIGYESAFQMLQAVSTGPAVPLARVPWNEPGILMKLLDSGAYGIICPMINNPQQAADFAAACRYPPMGYRSYGPNRVIHYAGADYAQHANSEILCLAQIETEEAVFNLDGILAVPGIDGIYIGPGDLSLSVGAPPSMAPSDSRVLAAMESVLSRTLARGLIAGVHTDGPETTRKRYAEGFHFCSVQTDMRMLLDAARTAVRDIKGN